MKREAGRPGSDAGCSNEMKMKRSRSFDVTGSRQSRAPTATLPNARPSRVSTCGPLLLHQQTCVYLCDVFLSLRILSFSMFAGCRSICSSQLGLRLISAVRAKDGRPKARDGPAVRHRLVGSKHRLSACKLAPISNPSQRYRRMYSLALIVLTLGDRMGEMAPRPYSPASPGKFLASPRLACLTSFEETPIDLESCSGCSRH